VRFRTPEPVASPVEPAHPHAAQCCEGGAARASLAPRAMLAFLQYLIALVLVESADAGVAVTARPDVTGIVLVVAGVVLAARVVGSMLSRATGPDDRDTAIPRVLFVTTLARVVSLAALHFAAGPLAGVRIVEALGVERWAIVPRLLQMAPFLAMVAGIAWGLQPATAVLRVGPRSGARAVAGEFRNALLPLTSVVLLVGVEDLFRLSTPETPAGRAISILRVLPALHIFAWLAVVFAGLLAMPFILRLAIRARPLPDGPLRQRLEAYSRRVGFRCRDILLWPAGGDVLNAAVIGAFPRFRYVIVTQGLIQTLGEDEIEAVFAHEAGHARRGHVLLFFGFTSVFALAGLVPGAAGVLDAVLAPLPPLLRGLVFVVVWAGVVFGWVSRRFEQEADVFGVDTLPLPPGETDPSRHPFTRAMERIGAEAGGLREVTGWRHFSIADRIAFVRSYVADEAVRRAWRRSIGILRWTLIVVISGFALAAGMQVPGEVRAAQLLWDRRSDPQGLLLATLHAGLGAEVPQQRADLFLRAAGLAAAAGRDDAAARLLRESVALGETRLPALVTYAGVLELGGRPAGARLVWADVAARPDAPPQLAELARSRAAGGPR
jgi:STE24 endopeptidase